MPRRKLHFAVVALMILLSSATIAATRSAGSAQAAAPNAHHQRIQGGIGTWEGTMTMFMPGVPPQPIPARQVVEAIGPYWIQATFECNVMGMPYVGTGCQGYDPLRERYVGTWVDSTSSFFAYMEGHADEKTDTLHMEWVAPDMSGAPARHRSETVQVGDHFRSVFFVGPGEGTKSMEMEMQRVDADSD